MQLILSLIYFFIFGLIVGSFLNVVALRYGTGMSIGFDRSKCFSCGKTLRWYELVPLFSFLFLRGKCKKCRSKISWQYPAIELLTGLLFLLTFLKINSFSQFFDLAMLINCAFFFTIFSILIVITIYDFRHKIIPDGLVFVFIFLSFVRVLYLIFTVSKTLSIGYSLVMLASGPLVAMPLFLLWLLSRGKWMGFGDVKLSLGIGWLLGFAGGISSIVLAFEIGAAVSLLLLAFGHILKGKIINKLSLPLSIKKLTIKSEIPFAPFLVLGTILIFFLEWDLMGINMFLRMFGL